MADEVVAAGGGVALCEHEVGACEDRGQSLGESRRGWDGEGDARIANLALGAHEALGHGRLGLKQGSGDLRHLQSADEPQRERHLCLDRKGRVAAGEDHPELVVSHGLHLAWLLLPLVLNRSRFFAAALRLTPHAVPHPVAGDGRDPGARTLGDAIDRPRAKRGDERLLHRVLGGVEVAELVSQRREHATRLGPERPLDDLLHVDGRVREPPSEASSTPPCSSTGITPATFTASSTVGASRR